jgi:branched-chain amino acid transport system substrate-binding protein
MKKQRFNIIAAFLLVVVGAIALVSYFNRNRDSDDNIAVVHAIVFQTGPQANLGQEVTNAFELFRSQLAAPKSLKLTVSDSKDTPAVAIDALKSVRKDSAEILICTGDVVSLTLGPLVDELGIPCIATVAAGPGIVELHPWMFRVWSTAEGQAEYVALAASKKFKSAAILTIDNEYGVSSSRKFEDIFSQNGGEIVGKETYGIVETNPRSQVEKVLGKNPECVFISGFGNGYPATIKIVRESGFSGQIYCDNTISVPFFRAIVGDSVNGIIFVGSEFDEFSLDEKASKFVAEYKAMFNTVPSFTAAYAYDSIKIAYEVARNSDFDHEGDRRELIETTFDGLNGSYDFSEVGEAGERLVLKKFEAGKIIHLR